MNVKRSLACVFSLLLCTTLCLPELHAVEQIVELRLQKVKALNGLVVYPNGDAVKGARVAEVTSDWNTELRATTTDSEGRFSLAPVKGRKIYHLQITVPGAAGINPLRAPVKINRLWGKKLLRLQLSLA